MRDLKVYQHIWYLKNKEKRLQQTSEWQRTHRSRLNELQKIRAKRNRDLVLAGYGNKCQCCNESNPRFLTIDHIFNDGYRDKLSIYKTPGSLHIYLIKNNFPTDRYRLLCFNCNCGRQWNGGICPHMKS